MAEFPSSFGVASIKVPLSGEKRSRVRRSTASPMLAQSAFSGEEKCRPMPSKPNRRRSSLNVFLTKYICSGGSSGKSADEWYPFHRSISPRRFIFSQNRWPPHKAASLPSGPGIRAYNSRPDIFCIVSTRVEKKRDLFPSFEVSRDCALSTFVKKDCD